ncbi:MAG: histidine kinase dimerization/phosphoacceptor domain -containing protein [Erythrobacter sp.]|jgi:two-component sensor histidine kinase|nr:histidine kinase dimerization/phosphoacceptor domain -containing protein [Erythrobacter sp.]
MMNNLSVVDPIIRLESRDLSDDECRQAFSRKSGRIHSISSLYRRLTLLRSTDTVQADEYLTAISHELANSSFVRRNTIFQH